MKNFELNIRATVDSLARDQLTRGSGDGQLFAQRNDGIIVKESTILQSHRSKGTGEGCFGPPLISWSLSQRWPTVNLGTSNAADQAHR